MALTTYFWNDPIFSLADFPSLLDEFRDVSGPAQRRMSREGSTALRPKMDLHEDADSNTVTATFDLPGLSKEAVNIDIHNSRLTISGENQLTQEKMEKGYTVRERGYGRFSRALPLPPGTKPDNVKANMKDGVLTVTFPKMSAEQKPARVTIN